MVDDPAHYRWTSYRHNVLGQANSYLSPHSLYLSLEKGDKTRQAAYRRLFRSELDKEAIDDIRQALNQNQSLGDSRFYANIEAMTGQRREPKPRGRPSKQQADSPAHQAGRVNYRFEEASRNILSLARLIPPTQRVPGELVANLPQEAEIALGSVSANRIQRDL